MGTREPGTLSKAIDQMRIDLVESSDPELRTTYVDFDSLLVVLEAAREAALKDFVLEWLAYGSQINLDNPAEAETAALGFLTGLAQVQAPFDELVPKEIPTYVTCGAISFDGNLSCDRAEGHTEDHGVKTPEGQVLWARLCRVQRPDLMPDGTVVICDRDAGHSDSSEHYDSAQGVSW